MDTFVLLAFTSCYARRLCVYACGQASVVALQLFQNAYWWIFVARVERNMVLVMWIIVPSIRVV